MIGCTCIRVHFHREIEFFAYRILRREVRLSVCLQHRVPEVIVGIRHPGKAHFVGINKDRYIFPFRQIHFGIDYRYLSKQVSIFRYNPPPVIDTGYNFIGCVNLHTLAGSTVDNGVILMDKAVHIVIIVEMRIKLIRYIIIFRR